MKRKQATIYNLGGTYQFVSMEDLNRLQTGGFCNPVSNGCSHDVYGAKDYSYKTRQGTAPASFRYRFKVWDWDMIGNDEMGDEVFSLGHLQSEGGAWVRPVYYFFGYRIVVEYFDTNAIIDFTGKLEDGAILAHAMRKFVQLYSKDYNVEIINEHLINVSAN